MKYDVVLKNGMVVDYETDVATVADLAIKDGKVVKTGPEINAADAEEHFELEGLTVVPGIIDPHVHASSWLGGAASHKMMAKAGVTTALDMSGPADSVFDLVQGHGAGLSIATIEAIRPGYTVSSSEPGDKELAALLDRVMKQGSIGVKVLGGHYPLSPEATGRCIKTAAKYDAYIAFHAGTTNKRSNIEGFLEAVDIAGGLPLHLAHINAYCRGTIKPRAEETEIALQTLTDNPNIISEAYLSPLNAGPAEIINGVVGSGTMAHSLKVGGFSEDAKGMEEAILNGWAQINYPHGGEVLLITGREGVDYWKSQDTKTTVSFAINPVEPRVNLACAKRPDGSFVVDAICTDGGGIPRNVIIPMGLALIELSGLSWKEFVRKTSYTPARMLGLVNKGSLAEGKDADITVIDPARREAEMTFIGGRLCLYKGNVFGKGGTIITTKEGEAYVKSKGLGAIVVRPEDRANVR